MISLAPWYFRNLLGENNFVEEPDFYEITLLDGKKVFESNCRLKNHLRPNWLEKSNLYKDADGTGAAKTKNIAVYKGISEAIERWAFYQSIDADQKKYAFDVNPTTTGMASFPHFLKRGAREKAKSEAIERWAIHQFNRKKLPVTKNHSKILGLEYFRINVPFNNYFVTLLSYKKNGIYFYGFASSSSEGESFFKALVELDRNLRMEKSIKGKMLNDFDSSVDRTLFYFSTQEGKDQFDSLINSSPRHLQESSGKILCDREIIGPWCKFSVVWRYLIDEAYFDTSKDHTFFMF